MPRVAPPVLRDGTIVEFKSGDVEARGIVRGFMEGHVFVHADRVVPIIIGRNTDKAVLTEGNRLWLDVPGATLVKDRDGCTVGLQLPELVEQPQ